ncbi:MAG: flagellar basal body P-ring formation chaperone FlgA [Hydrogenobaculum sp.]
MKKAFYSAFVLLIFLPFLGFSKEIVFSQSYVEKLVKKEIEKQYGKNIKVDSVNCFVYKPFTVDSKDISVSLRIPPLSPDAYASININSNNILQRTYNAIAYIEWRVPVIVAKKLITRGQIITKNDIKSTIKYIRFVPQNLVVSKRQVIGATALQNIGIGEPIRTSMISMVPVIRYGDIVRVIYDNGYIRITTKAKAMQNGYLGKFVRLQPLDNPKTFITGKVIDKDTVLISPNSY